MAILQAARIPKEVYDAFKLPFVDRAYIFANAIPVVTGTCLPLASETCNDSLD